MVYGLVVLAFGVVVIEIIIAAVKSAKEKRNK